MKLPALRATSMLMVLLIIAVGIVAYNAFYQSGIKHEASASIAPSHFSSRLIGSRRPDFSLPDMDGLPRQVGEWDGQILVINFWADWCQPCRREIPAFIKLQSDLSAQGVQFIGMALDERDVVETFSRETRIVFNYPILTGVDAVLDVIRDYGNATGILPYTVVVDRKGLVAGVQFGEMSAQELRAMLAPLLDLGL